MTDTDTEWTNREITKDKQRQTRTGTDKEWTKKDITQRETTTTNDRHRQRFDKQRHGKHDKQRQARTDTDNKQTTT